MEEQPNSWVRRGIYSHTVYHRMDSLAFQSIPLSKLPPLPPNLPLSRGDSALKLRPETSGTVHGLESVDNRANRKFPPIKQRSLSPLPRTELPETFKEARNDKRRFATPTPRRKGQEKGFIGKLFNRDIQRSQSCEGLASTTTASPKQFSSSHKSKKRDSAWSKYFDHGSGRVTALEMADEWEADMSQLFLGHKFAKGAHSQLYHGIYKDQPVAVKIIRTPDDDENGGMTAQLERQFSREVSLLSQLHHPNVIKLVAACREPTVFCVITEYLSGGSLRAFMHKLDHNAPPLQKQIAIALDIARGMEYIHSQGVIHRDLKPENIIFDQYFHLKIVDFGIACHEAYCDVLAEDAGTYRWMAPEMIKHKPYSRKVDVYSFGLVLWEMLAGAVPYETMTPIQAAFAVVSKNLRPIIPTDCPPALGALVEQCWTSRSEKRPEFWQIVKILEKFEASLADDGILHLGLNSACEDHKKGLLHWIQKHCPLSSDRLDRPDRPCVPKPKFS